MDRFVAMRWRSCPIGKLLSVVLLLCAFGVSTSIRAQESARKESDFVVHDFRFQTGEVLPELRLHYVTFGNPKRDAAGRVTNAVLLLHGVGGNSRRIIDYFASQLFGEGQALDTSKYYLILPDAIGHGGSSKPSDGLRSRFPRYDYTDMVEAQHRLVAEGLGIDHLRLVMGVSMGGMHTWIWGTKYPEMMDALMPIASMPTRVAGMYYIWRRVIAEAIRNDPDWNGGSYEKPPTRWLSSLPLFFAMVDSRARLQSIAPTQAKSKALYDGMVDRGRKLYDANDFLYALDAARDYDPAPELGKIKAKLLALNFTDDLINATETGIVEAAVAKIPNARSVVMAPSGESFGHSNLGHPEIWKNHLVELLKSLPQAMPREAQNRDPGAGSGTVRIATASPDLR